MTGPGFYVSTVAAAAAGAMVGSGFAVHAGTLVAPPLPAIRGVAIRVRRPLPFGAACVCAAVPVAAAVFCGEPFGAAAATIMGWLLAGIAIYDHRALMIPHVLSIGGIAAGLGCAWVTGGWPLAAERGTAAVLLAGGFWCASRLASAVRRGPAVGAADFGVIAFVGALCGLQLGLDVILAAGVAGLALVHAPRPSTGRRLLHHGGILAGAGAAAFGGAAGAATAALMFVLLRREAGSSSKPVPFGACLVLGLFVVVLLGATPPLSDVSPVRRDAVLRYLISTAP